MTTQPTSPFVRFRYHTDAIRAAELLSKPPVNFPADFDVAGSAPVTSLFETPDEYARPTQTIQGLGLVSCYQLPYTQRFRNTPPRLRRSLTANLGGIDYSLRVTEAERSTGGINDEVDSVVMLPGFTEMIDTATGCSLHKALSRHFPERRIISIGTDGVGAHTASIGWKEGWHKDFTAMAEARHKLISAFAGRGVVTLVGVSMGSVLSNRLLAYDLQLQSDRFMRKQTGSQPLDIDAAVFHSHALIAPGHVPVDMFLRFLPHVPIDVGRVGLESESDNRLASLLKLSVSLPKAAPALAGNIKNLVQGTTDQALYSVSGNFPTGFVSGERDPLRQEDRLRRLETAMPEMVSVNIVKRVGHAACFDAPTAARHIAEMYTTVTNKSNT